MADRCAIITGVAGQDGWDLSHLLLDKGYRVVGTSRDPVGARGRTHPSVDLTQWDMEDEAPFAALLRAVRPTEVYNLAAFASGAAMYDDPVGIGSINGLAVARLLKQILIANPSIRFCQASSSEMFGVPAESPQSETTVFQPRSPYGAAKLYAHHMVGIYRVHHGLFACSAILFNHESVRRGPEFVTGKVAAAVARIKLGLADELVLGDLDARRDWGRSCDYVKGMWSMLQDYDARDYVLATGKTHSVRDLCELAFGCVGLDYRKHVRVDPQVARPVEKLPLVGDSTLAKRKLDWSPNVDFAGLVRMMVNAELESLVDGIEDR